jgi:long-subunit fatty acid transport protein
MKKLLLSFMLIVFSVIAFAQNEADEAQENRWVPNHNYNHQLRPGFSPTLGLHTGASFGRWGNNNFFSTFINPNLSQQINNRFILSTGVVMMRNNFNMTSVPYEGSGAPIRNGFVNNQAIVYGSGSYLVNDRTILTGSAFYSINENNPYFQQLQNGKGFSMGIDYKVSDKVSIGAGFRYSEGGNMWGNPWMMPGGGMFGASPFGNPGMNRNNNFW